MKSESHPPAGAGGGARVIYGLEDRPPLVEAVPLAVQHLLAMLLGNITPPLLIAGALSMATGETAFLLQMALLAAGLATLVQAYPIGPVGGRIPVVMGTSIAFVGAIVAIARSHGIATALGACLVASVVEIALGFGVARLQRFFPPLVNGVVVMLIGLTLIPVGMDYAAGGKGAPDYGSLTSLGIAGLVLAVTLLLNRFARGFLSYASMLVGVGIGYAVAAWLGRVDLAPIGEAGWFALPRLLPFGLDFALGPILAMGFVYVITAMETIGDVSGILAAEGREPTERELSGGLVADGVASGAAAFIGAFPNTSYSQNVGLVNFTGVVSRHVTGVAGVILVALGLVPKIGALFATIPAPVIGGAGILMFAMIFSSGLAIVHRGVTMTRRNLVILATAVGLGLAVELRPAALVELPEQLRTFLGSGLITGGFTALVLNVVFPADD